MLLRKLLLTGLVIGPFTTVGAETLQLNPTAETRDEAQPSRGMSADRVTEKFGSPDAKIAAVGDPPISRWEYREFIVYFEYDRVIHAVIKR